MSYYIRNWSLDYRPNFDGCVSGTLIDAEEVALAKKRVLLKRFLRRNGIYIADCQDIKFLQSLVQAVLILKRKTP